MADTPTEIDPRLTRLSYSGRSELHTCPRKFQLNKLARHILGERTSSVTFAYGHAVGAGIQSTLEGKSWQAVVFDMFLAWDFGDLLATEDKTKKGFFEAIFAVQSFGAVRTSLLAQYELAYFKGKPAVELSFKIVLPSGFIYRGYVDVVLKHKTNGKFMVLELKTTGMKYVMEATYKNSSQALGYSIILDALAPASSDYEVMYLVYKSTAQEYEHMKFSKSYSDRAFWIKDLMMDVERIQYYEEQGRYPGYGESCVHFNRECEWISNCQLSDIFLLQPYDPETDLTEIDVSTDEFGTETRTPKVYTLELNLIDLIDSQLTRGSM